MDWIEVAVIGIDGEAAEALSEVMTRFGQGGSVIENLIGTEDNATSIENVLIVKTYLADEPETAHKLQKLREALWHLNIISPMPEPQIRRLAQADWASAWKQHYTRTKPGKRLVIVPAWEEVSLDSSELLIRIDPGMAFGTGTHPSTQLCLILMEDFLLPGHRFFDVGTGSGILSLAAARLQAAEIVACDTDPIAVQAARENATLNNIQNLITVKVGSIDSFSGLFDVIVINILSDVIVQILPDAVSRLAPEGHILLAGMIVEQEAEVLAKLQELALTVSQRLICKDWLALAVRKSNP